MRVNYKDRKVYWRFYVIFPKINECEEIKIKVVINKWNKVAFWV